MDGRLHTLGHAAAGVMTLAYWHISACAHGTEVCMKLNHAPHTSILLCLTKILLFFAVVDFTYQISVCHLILFPQSWLHEESFNVKN